MHRRTLFGFTLLMLTLVLSASSATAKPKHSLFTWDDRTDSLQCTWTCLDGRKGSAEVLNADQCEAACEGACGGNCEPAA